MVIVGTGIVGAATAFYLSASGSGQGPITLLDAVGPAAASSGKAGAFLTNEPPAFRQGVGGNKDKTNDKRRALFQKSFELHRELAKDLNLESYCQVQNYQSIETKQIDFDNGTNGISEASQKVGECGPQGNVRFANNPQQTMLQSLAENGRGTPFSGDAALVDPAELVASMMDKVLSRSNCSFHKATVSSLEVDSQRSCVTAIHCEGSPPTKISVDDDEPIVIALGPWSSQIEDWLGIPLPIEGVLSTSLVFQDEILDSDVGTAFFFDEDSNGCHLEVFGRRDKSLYISGCGESQVISTRRLRSNERPVPNEPCAPDLSRIAAAKSSLQKAGYNLHDTPATNGASTGVNNRSGQQIATAQACIRPVSPDGIPVVGKLLDNVYVATGGGPWGITWGPLMGKSLASLISDNHCPPISLRPLSPKRFDTLVYKTLLKSRSSSNNS